MWKKNKKDKLKQQGNEVKQEEDEFACYCDENCLDMGDCCEDYKAFCEGRILLYPVSLLPGCRDRVHYRTNDAKTSNKAFCEGEIWSLGVFLQNGNP